MIYAFGILRITTGCGYILLEGLILIYGFTTQQARVLKLITSKIRFNGGRLQLRNQNQTP